MEKYDGIGVIEHANAVEFAKRVNEYVIFQRVTGRTIIKEQLDIKQSGDSLMRVMTFWVKYGAEEVKELEARELLSHN